MWLGDFPEDFTTVVCMFTTHDGNGAPVAPLTAFEAADVIIYKNGSATQKTTTNGVTMTSPFDSIVGLHCVVVDTSNDTGDSGFWTSGGGDVFDVVLSPDSETVNGQTVLKVVGKFGIGLAKAGLKAGAITTATFGAGAINAAAIADGAIDRATFAADTGLQSIRSNTAQAGASGSITLDASASATDNLYRGCLVYLTGGTGAGQFRVVNGYTGSSKVATVVPNWITNPDNTSTFAVLPAGMVDLEVIQNVAVSTTTAQLGVNAVQAGATAWNSGAIKTTTFTAGAIDAAAVADGAIDAATFAASAINAAAIASDAITAAKIATGAITSAKFAAGAIDAAAVADGAIDAATFAASAINAAAIASDAITAAKIATAAITSAKFAAGAIDAAAVADGAIDAATFAASAINAAAIASDAITAAKIATGAITSAKFAAGAIDAAAIATDAIDADALAADAVAEIQSGLSTLNAAGVRSAVGLGSANLDTQLAAIDDYIDTEVAAIKAKTDNLPSDPADASDIAGAFSTVNSTLATIAAYVDTEVAAIKAKTDNLPSDPADASDIASSFSSIASTLATIAAYIDTEVAAIKAKTDNLPASPAATSDIPTAGAVADAVWEEDLSDHSGTVGSTAEAVANLDDTITSRAAPGDAMTLTGGERTAVANALLLLADAIEDGIDVRGSLRAILAMVSGVVTGAGTGTEVFKNPAGDTTRATVTDDASGNRSEVVLNV